MKRQIFNYEISIYISKLEKREGICSQKDDGTNNHMLLADFDNVPLDSITASLRETQERYNLPNIYIIESSTSNYHAYCFCSRTFREIIMLLSSIPYIDEKYLKLGIMRGYYTLRISPRKNEQFEPVLVMESMWPAEIEVNQMTFNEYLTSNKGGHDA